MGRQPLAINVISLFVALREETRLPFRTIRWPGTVHGLSLSLGAIVEATQKAAGGPTGGADILEQVRGNPAVHTDEMGWWEYGHNDERR